jgi:hypothetical protein
MRARFLFFTMVASLLSVSAFSQSKSPHRKPIETRHPAINAPASPAGAPAPSGDFSSILNGLPVLLQLHHDTEVGTNRPVDIYSFVIELQIVNSDGDLEPEGLQIFNFYTAKPQDPNNDVNPRNARDCAIWNKLVNGALQHRDPRSQTWPYVEFTVAEGARVLQTNEHGSVWWSDDVECWGSSDRFPPF